MTARLALLGTTALATIAAGLFLYARRIDESWYGISLGQEAREVANVRVEPATATYPEVGIVDPPPPPWSQIRLSVGRRTHRISGIEFTDLGREQWVCDVSPCPLAPRLKPVAQTRAEGARVKSDLIDRLGAPTSSYGSGNEIAFIWDFNDPGLECVRGQLRPRILAGDRSGLVQRVTLRLSDDIVDLAVEGRESFESVPGVFAPPSPPPSPRPPPPPCG